MANSLTRETQAIIRKLEKQGWQVTLKNGHYRCFNPATRQLVFTGGTPSDSRAVKNFRSQLRRAGARDI